jgi:regulator of PEP synthase PpsR (kinase-PPPase family)
MTKEDTTSQIFVVSDATGETCAAAVRGAMLQFQSPWRMRIFGGVRRTSQVDRIVPLATEAGALVVFTLVDKRLAQALLDQCADLGVATVDLLGPLISKVAQRLNAEPRRKPGLLHGFSDDYFQRIEAVEFAVRHDDGANLHTLFEADIVLAGVSRTSKTPLAMYLAQRGYKVGNVPLIPDVDPPRPLLELDARKVFGLLMDPLTLLSVRQARIRALPGAPYSTYADSDAIMLEIDRARRLFREYGWRTIDVGGRAVEENASRILEYHQSSPHARAQG